MKRNILLVLFLLCVFSSCVTTGRKYVIPEEGIVLQNSSILKIVKIYTPAKSVSDGKGRELVPVDETKMITQIACRITDSGIGTEQDKEALIALFFSPSGEYDFVFPSAPEDSFYNRRPKQGVSYSFPLFYIHEKGDFPVALISFEKKVLLIIPEDDPFYQAALSVIDQL